MDGTAMPSFPGRAAAGSSRADKEERATKGKESIEVGDVEEGGDTQDITNLTVGGGGAEDDHSSAQWVLGDNVNFSLRQMSTVRWVCKQLYTSGARESCREKGLSRCVEKLQAYALQAANMATYVMEEFEGLREKEPEAQLLSLKLKAMQEELGEARRRLSEADSWRKDSEASSFVPGCSLEELQDGLEKDMSPLFQYPNIKHKFGDYKRRVKEQVEKLKEEARLLSQKLTDASVDAVVRFKSRPTYLEELKEAEEEGVRKYKASPSYAKELKEAKEEGVMEYKESPSYAKELKEAKEEGVREYNESPSYAKALKEAKEEGVKEYKESPSYAKALKEAKEEGAREYKKSPSYANALKEAKKNGAREYKASPSYAKEVAKVAQGCLSADLSDVALRLLKGGVDLSLLESAHPCFRGLKEFLASRKRASSSAGGSGPSRKRPFSSTGGSGRPAPTTR